MRLGIFGITAFAASVSTVSVLIQAPSVRADEESVSYPVGYRAWTFLHSSLENDVGPETDRLD